MRFIKRVAIFLIIAVVGIGPDFIAVEKKDLGLWYVDLEHSGGA